MSQPRFRIEKRVTVAVSDKLCACRVSIQGGANKESRIVHSSQCQPSHKATIRKLEAIAEEELEAMLK
ncbi:MAG TPA: hypothetical protein VKW06_00450 [Candidatus Angelobacter sp.]|nr:hypothetical protein [Candidatus Angelobacter sp.]